MSLQRTLTRFLGGPRRRKPEGSAANLARSKLARETMAEAARIGCTIETDRRYSPIVWPPAGLDESRDPYAGDHEANGWKEAASMVAAYAALVGEGHGKV